MTEGTKTLTADSHRKRSWWLTDGEGTSFGPFFKEQIATRLGRYRLYRRHSSASRRACWAKAGESPFTRDAVGRSGDYVALLRGEISSAEYVRRVKADVRRRFSR